MRQTTERLGDLEELDKDHWATIASLCKKIESLEQKIQNLEKELINQTRKSLTKEIINLNKKVLKFKETNGNFKTTEKIVNVSSKKFLLLIYFSGSISC